MAMAYSTNMSSPVNPPPRGDSTMRGSNSTKNNNNDTNNHESPSKYHALIIDSGAIIKQTSLTSFGGPTNSLLTSAKHYYTVPAVLSEIRDAKSRKHLEEFQLRLESLHNTSLVTRSPSKDGIAAMSEFARKTGDYSQLSGVDLQVLALLYDLEVEASKLYNGGKLDHVRTEPKRVLGVHVKPLNGDGKRDVKRRERGGSVSTVASESVAGGSSSSVAPANGIVSSAAFFRGNADGIIDVSHVDFEYEEDVDGNRMIVDPAYGSGDVDEEREDSVNETAANKDDGSSAPSKPKSWALMVNPEKASTAPLVDYSIGTSSAATKQQNEDIQMTEEVPKLDLKKEDAAPAVAGQFDDASEEGSNEEDDEDAFSTNSGSDGELDAINIANATSDDEMSDEECDVFILEPHEAAYLKKLKEEKAQKELVEQMEQQTISSQGAAANEGKAQDNEGGLESEFPSLAAAAAVPYEGSDDEMEDLGQEATAESQLAWQQEEEERKKKSLQPMVNGRIVQNKQKQTYNSFRKYKNIVSADGSAMAMKKQNEGAKAKEEEDEAALAATEGSGNVDGDEKEDPNNTNQAYKSRILGAGASSNTDFPTEMTADDDDGEGWVTCTRDIQNMKATGSLHLDSSRNHRNNARKSSTPPKNAGPPISQRAACATTDFAMQNVILQMNLELLSVDGVRVRRLKTWVTRCGACFTIYGNDDKKKTQRMFCDKCGSNTLQRIAASVDRNTGRLKLHMRKNYQYNTRGTKFSLPKAGKVGDMNIILCVFDCA